MSGFSAAIKIGDLDDFLSPATDCVILPAKPEVSKRSSASVIKSTPKQEDNVASITLSDCLACSGCVTSAETVLLQSQSVDELLSLSQSSPKKIYFSVSSASRRALSEFYKIPPGRVCRYLEASLSKVLSPSAVYVLDTSVAESIVVEETRREMLDRKQVLITSHCPGWSCYATKVLDESILSHMSRVKSPEQLMGLIVKRLIPCILAQTKFFRTSQIRNLRHFFSAPNDEILHVLISPCFDKKLEIIRPDYTTTEKVKAVDLVLATSELLDLMSRTTHIDRNNIKESKEMFDIHEMFSLRDSWAVSESGCDSGGYAQAALTRMGNYDWMHEKNKDIL
jgi:iron only hydrogenase large subunit-like protein